MPFKEKVLPLLDRLDPVAKKVGAVNTIVNTHGVLKGYNTDVTGAIAIFSQMKLKPKDRVLVLGAGGVARAIVYALKALKISSIAVANRTPSKIKLLSKIAPVQAIAWKMRNEVGADIIINATSIGMAPQKNAMPLSKDTLKNCRAVFDVVINPVETKLLKEARKLGKRAYPGYRMTLLQAAAQFELYTGRKAPLNVMKQTVERIVHA
jgi:shikimate dehydrogenase